MVLSCHPFRDYFYASLFFRLYYSIITVLFSKCLYSSVFPELANHIQNHSVSMAVVFSVPAHLSHSSASFLNLRKL